MHNASQLRDIVAGIGVDVMMACTDPAIYTLGSDDDGFALHTWTAAAPEQVEAHILDILQRKLNSTHDESDQLHA